MAGSTTIVRSLLTLLLLTPIFVAPPRADAQSSAFAAEIERHVQQVMPQVVAWRRDIHEHPELGNREFRTAKLVADHLRALGIEVQTGVAHTGVVGVLRGGRPGPVVALRADMDALPVTEQVDLPFASQGARRVQRAGSRRDARLRTRQPRGDPAWASPTCSPGMRDQLARHREVHLPAGRGRSAGRARAAARA